MKRNIGDISEINGFVAKNITFPTDKNGKVQVSTLASIVLP